MFVCDENGLDIGKGRPDGVQIFLDGAGADARVDQDLRIGSFHVNGIAGGAGVKGVCGDISHDIPRTRPKDERKAR